MYYDPLIDFKNTLPFSGSWIMWGFYLLPNDRAMAERFYEAAKKSCLIEKPDGTAHMVAVPGITADHPYITVRTLSLANELGDTEVVKKIRAHVEAHYEPTWDTDAGEFYYLFGLKEPYPRGQYNANLVVSDVSGPGAWWRLFNEPNLTKFDEPTVYGVDYPRMGLSQAYYDRNKRTLVLQTYAATPSAAGSPTRFRVKNLGQPGDCTVFVDGMKSDDWTVQDGEMEISATIDTKSIRIVES